MAEKSTIKTSRKIYSLEYTTKAILLFNFICIFANIASKNTVDASVMITVSGSLAGIAGTLNIADGWKGHES